MPNQPATPARTVRLDDEVWERLRERADDEGTSVAEVIRRAIRAYLRDYR